MRRTAGVAALLVGLAWFAGPAGAAGKDVKIQNTSYVPSSVNIQVGDSVTWSNDDNTIHTVTSDADSAEQFDSGQMAPNPNLKFTWTFNKAGTFNYHCNIHSSMHGTVHVAEVVTTTLPVTTTTTVKPTTTTAKPTTTTAKPTTTTSSTTTTTAPTTTVTIGVLETTSEPSTTSSTSTTLELTSGSHKSGSSGGKVALIVVAILAVGGAGGYGLWRLWPNRGGDAEGPPPSAPAAD